MTVEQLLAGVVIPIDKPRQWTSFQTVNKIKSTIRNLFGIKKFKIGHAGTLDPLATGLLLVCVGRATKEISQLQAGEKVYTSTIVLGATTPCYDMEQPIDHYYPYSHITPDLLKTVQQQFLGDIYQTPPLFSAVRIDGRRAYEYARHDAQVAPPVAKQVHITEFEVTSFHYGSYPPETIDTPIADPQTTPSKAPHLYNNPINTIPAHLPHFDIRVRCSKGTYIRSLARDIGIALQSGAFVSSLRREAIGNYSIQQAIEIEQVASYLAQ